RRLLVDGVFQFDRGCRRKLLCVFSSDKCQRDGFVVAQGQQESAHTVVLGGMGGFFYRPDKSRQGIGEAVEAVDAGELLDQVNFLPHVKPPAGNVDSEIEYLLSNSGMKPAGAVRWGGADGGCTRPAWSYGKAEAAENAGDLVITEVATQNAAYLAVAEGDHWRLDPAGDDIDFFAFELPSGSINNQPGYPRTRDGCRREIGASLEAMGGIGVQSMTPRTPANTDRVEPGGLDEHVFCPLADHGVESAHDAGQRHRTFRVGDYQVFGRKLAVHAVQGFQGLARTATADDDLSLQQVEIKSMRGMAHLPKRVIGSIGRAINAALAEGGESLGDSLWRWPDFQVAQDASGVTRAALGVFYLDRKR